MNKVKIIGNGLIAGLINEHYTKHQTGVVLTDSLEDCRLVVLCCKPNDTLRELELLPKHVKILDTSYLHRCSEGWIYGYRGVQKSCLSGASKVANAGCIATGANLLLSPLDVSEHVSINVSCGVSTGGNRLVHKYTEQSDKLVSKSCIKDHPHIAEIRKTTRLNNRFKISIAPRIIPSLYSGMFVEIVLFDVEFQDVVESYEATYDQEVLLFKNQKEVSFSELDKFLPKLYVNQLGQSVKVSCLYDNLYYAGVFNIARNISLMLELQ